MPKCVFLAFLILYLIVIYVILWTLRMRRRKLRSCPFKVGDKVLVHKVMGAPYIKCPIEGTVTYAYVGYAFDVRFEQYHDLTFGVMPEDMELV